MKQIKKEYILYGFIAIAFFFIGRLRISWLRSPERNYDHKRGTPQVEKYLYSKG
jgi:hypothetical protein